MAAGTAINVYAVYRSPPSRNQVTRVPKRRPASPHSWSRSRSPRRQRAATKPRMVTIAKKIMKTVKATALNMENLLYSSASSPQEIQRGGENGREYNPEHRVPVHEGYPDKRRVRIVVERRVQQGDKGNDEEDEQPGTPLPLDRRLGRHSRTPFISLVE